MDQPLQSQLDTYLHRLDHLAGEGQTLRDALANEPGQRRDLSPVSVWQRECAATISQLSGGNKAHWLSRAYSEAFLMSATSREGETEVSVVDIVDRILTVLEQAKASLSQADLDEVATASREAPPSAVSRFDFVSDLQLRSHLERAYADSRIAYERGDFSLAFVTSCSVLEALVTEALERSDRTSLSDVQPAGEVPSWTLDDRLAVAEQLGVISAACVRLPPLARRYRDLLDEMGDLLPDAAVSDLEAKRAAQVLKIIVRDLSPGR